MKTVRINVIAVCLLLAFFAMNSYGQTSSTKEEAKKKAKLEKAKVPKEVTETFYVEYPDLVYDDWYGYPFYESPSNWYDNYWYNDWYEYAPYAYVEPPEYYVVEFATKDKTPHKAIYSKAGKKIAVHKSLKSDLPQAVTAAINKSAYKDWTLGKDKEEIFKDTDKDLMKVYKVTVEKGKEKHTLFFQADGKLLKDNNDMKKMAKVEKTKVPKMVTDTYSKDFPNYTYEDWYAYPAYNDPSNWYNDYWYDDWYESSPYVYTQLPEYYQVDLIKDDTPYKAIYSKSGKKIAVHKSIKSDLPQAVTAAINKSVYKDWTMAKEKEEIYKDTDKDQLKVYKVTVEKGMQKHTLFFQTDGKLLKDKKLS